MLKDEGRYSQLSRILFSLSTWHCTLKNAFDILRAERNIEYMDYFIWLFIRPKFISTYSMSRLEDDWGYLLTWATTQHATTKKSSKFIGHSQNNIIFYFYWYFVLRLVISLFADYLKASKCKFIASAIAALDMQSSSLRIEFSLLQWGEMQCKFLLIFR